MLNGAQQKVKSTVISWLDRVKQFQNIFTAANDVYGNLAGVDIDDTSILAVQLSSLLGTARLLHVGTIGLPAGAITEDVITNSSMVASTLKKMIQASKISADNLVLAMPGSKVAIKEIKLARFLSDEEAEVRAKQEAQRAFPDLVKTLFLDFIQVVRPEKKYFLVIIFCRRDDILPRVDSVQQAGLTPKIMEVDFYALERAYPLFAAQLPRDHVDKYVAVIDFNPHSIVFMVMHKKTVIFRNRQVYNGDIFVSIVQRSMALAVSAVKTNNVTLNAFDSSLQHSAENRAEVLNEEQKTHLIITIRRLFQSFYSENLGKTIECIALSGRCALIPDIQMHLEKSFEIPVTVVNPLASLKISEHVDAKYAEKIAPALTLSCGMALRGIPLWK